MDMLRFPKVVPTHIFDQFITVGVEDEDLENLKKSPVPDEKLEPKVLFRYPDSGLSAQIEKRTKVIKHHVFPNKV